MKKEKKPSEKEVYRLWWEYLKRSKKYKIYCDAVRKVMDDAIKRKDKEYLEKIMRQILSHSSQKENKIIRQLFVSELTQEEYDNMIPLIEIMSMERNWLTFQDVFVTSFDDWWKTQEKMDFSLPVVVLNDPGALEKFPDFLKRCEQLKIKKGASPKPEEVIDILIEEECEYVFVAIPMVGKVTIEDISKQIADIRKKLKDDFTVADYYFRKYFMPVSRVRYDELKRYLRVYDLKQQGKKMKEIIAEIDPDRRGEDANIQRAFRSYLQKANKIINNVELGCFPEMPPDA
jgi:hemerythrin superfamily protein